MEKNTFPAPYRNRKLGASVGYVNVSAAPGVFSALGTCHAELERLKSAGFDTIIATEDGTPSGIATPSTGDALGNVVLCADRLGLGVLLLPPLANKDWVHAPGQELAEISQTVVERGRELLLRFDGRHSIVGWALPCTIDNQELMNEADRERLGRFIGALAEGLRGLGIDGPVLGMGGLSLSTDPAQTKQAWSRFLELASLDILILCIRPHDEAGGSLDRSGIEDQLWAVSRAADEQSIRLWGAVETTRLSDGAYRSPVALTQLERQIATMQRFTERLVAFDVVLGFLQPPTASHDTDDEGRLFRAYRKWHADRASDFSPPAPVVPTLPDEPPARTIEGSFAQIIGTAKYYADPTYVGEELDRMRAVGIRLIIPDSTYKDTAYYPSTVLKGRETSGDSLGTILDAAAGRDMQVLISLPHYDYAWVWTVGADTTEFLDRVDRVIEELHTLYGDRPAFHGWYIPYELCDAFLADERHRQSVASTFRHMVESCHRLAPEKPTMISPYFTTDLPDAAFVEIWSDVISRSGVDIVAMQDSVGALNVSGTETLRMQYLRHYIEQIANICEEAGAEFWWNVETFSQTRGTPIDTRGWAAVTADFARVATQIGFAAQRARKIINFDFPHYFSPGYPNREIAERNAVFYEAYNTWYESLPKP